MTEASHTKLLSDLRRNRDEILSADHIVQYKDYPVNGTFSFIKYVDHCMKQIEQKPNDESTEVLELLIKISSLQLQNIRKKGLNDDPENVKLWIDFSKLMTSNNHCLLIRNFGRFYLPWNLRFSFNVCPIALHEGGMKRTLYNMFNPSYRFTTAGEACENGSSFYLRMIMGVLNTAYPWVDPYLSIFDSVSRTEVILPRMNDCEVYLDSNRMGQFRINPEIRTEPFELKARIFQIKGKPSPKNSLLFHVQGGAFQALADFFHAPLMRNVTETLGIPGICVDYRHDPTNYPLAVQDVVDAYLFLTSGSTEVVDMIGFIPENIILTGDSAGGYLALMMIKALIEMESQKLITPIMKPTCIDLQYPVFFSHWNMDSITFSLIDIVLPFSPMMSIFCEFFEMMDMKPGWFHDPELLGEFFRRCEPRPSADPLKMLGKEGGLDFLDGIKLSLISGEFDPLFNQTIELAKLYPEKWFHSLDVAFNSTHGFVAELVTLKPKYCRLVSYRIAQMMDLPMANLNSSFVKSCETLIQEQEDHFSQMNQMIKRAKDINSNIL